MFLLLERVGKIIGELKEYAYQDTEMLSFINMRKECTSTLKLLIPNHPTGGISSRVTGGADITSIAFSTSFLPCRSDFPERLSY